MKLQAALAGLVLIGNLCPAHAQPGRRPVAQDRQPSVAQQPAAQRPGIAQTVHSVVQPWIAEVQAIGVMVVVRDGGKTHFFPFGQADKAQHKPVTPDSVFELASITKVFTTTSLAMEVLAGNMQFDDPVAKYLPYLRNHGGDIRQLTLKHLATHTSSLPRAPGGKRTDHEWNKQLLMQWFAEWKAPYPPGTKSLYSNIGVGLLGYAIENREEKPLIEVWREQFLDRLGMHHTFFEIPPAAAHLVVQGYGPQGQPVARSPVGGWPAGGRLHSSGHDMGEFLTANLGERPDLPNITVAMHFAEQPYFEASPKMTQGLAWQRVHISDELIIDKNGGLTGTSTYIGMIPKRRLGVVVMTNRGKCAATAVGRKLLLALSGGQYQGTKVDEEP